MKIIFLDIDGVLNHNPLRCWHGPDIISIPRVELLKRIVDHTGAAIVLSSAWRDNPRDRQLVDAALAKAGLSVHDVTPVIPKIWDRGSEINTWLDANPCSKFAVLDDFDLSEHFGDSFFLCLDDFTDKKTQSIDDLGLTPDIMDQVIKHLS